MAVATEEFAKTSAFSLQLALEGLSKDALTSIRKHASIKNASKLNREQLKQTLIEKLPEAYEIELIHVLSLMDQQRIEVLAEVVRRNGILSDPAQFTEQQLQYWLELGLLFQATIDQKKVVAMPVELVSVVQHALKQFDHKISGLNTTLIECVKGMMYYYGALSHEELGKIVSRYAMFEQLKAPFMHVIIDYRHYHNDFGLNEQYVYHAAIPDPSLIIKEQKQREQIPFASFTALELQKASTAGSIQRTQAHQLLVDCLMKQFKVSKLDALLIADQSEFGIRAGLQLQDLVEYMKRELIIQDEQTLNILLPRLIIMYNHTPQWFLKGHNSASLTQSSGGEELVTEITHPNLAQAVQSPEIGRNDPCYCGSGKKYKKCCINKA